MSLNLGKGSSKQSNNSTTSQTATPNNLGALQTGWNTATDLLNGTNGNSTADANNGLALTATGANNTSAAANGGLATATNLANGGATNSANGYLTPFADGSMTGNNNPYFANLTTQLSQVLQGQTDGTFAAAGRYGSGADANAFNSALANEVGQLGYTNYNDSLNRQTGAADQLSTNSTNSTNAALQALGVIPGLGTATAGAGASLYGAGAAPTATYANILQLLGSGGDTVNGTTTGSGTASNSNVGLAAGSTAPGGVSILSLLGL